MYVLILVRLLVLCIQLFFTVLTEVSSSHFTVKMLCKSEPQKYVEILLAQELIELGECLRAFGPESPVFPFAVQKTQSLKYTELIILPVFVWV